MSIEEIRDFCLALPYTDEATPFGDNIIIYKVGGKWFAVVDLSHNNKVVVKCDPDRAIELRDRHEEITPAWHFNKRHWNAIRLDGDLTDDFIYEQIYHSYSIVIEKSVRPRSLRIEILEAVNHFNYKSDKL